MYAIVDIAGQQFKVEKGKKIFVNRLDAEPGTSLDFTTVLLTDQDGAVKVGSPYVDGAVVKASVVDHLKGKKVIVFKKKRRKGYQKKNGHRQYLTEILIDEIA
jgi:large subunit ribosomal protein L21